MACSTIPWSSLRPSSDALPFSQADAGQVGSGAITTATASPRGWPGPALKPGITYGRTDDIGWKVAENPVTWHDFHATVLHLLGLDHERLTFYHNGIERRLTNVHGDSSPRADRLTTLRVSATPRSSRNPAGRIDFSSRLSTVRTGCRGPIDSSVDPQGFLAQPMNGTSATSSVSHLTDDLYWRQVSAGRVASSRPGSNGASNADWAPIAVTDADRMAALVRFAETVLEHGRDTYGERHTPLFVDFLEVSTLKAPEKMYITRLGGPGPRSKHPYQPVIASNLAHQGKPQPISSSDSATSRAIRKYEDAYKECLRYYFEHYRVPNGLLQMGHHRFVDVKDRSLRRRRLAPRTERPRDETRLPLLSGLLGSRPRSRREGC